MRNTWSICWFTIGILALVFIYVFAPRSGSETKLVRTEALVGNLSGVDRIEFVRTAGACATLQCANGTWKIVAPYEGSVETSVFKHFLDVLEQAPIDDRITSADLLKLGRTQADFSLSEPVLQIRLRRSDRETTLLFGMQTPSGKGVYAADTAADSVLVVSTNVFAALDLTPAMLRRRTIVPILPENVASFEIRDGSERVVAVQRDGDGWTVDGKLASTEKVAAFLTTLSKAHAESFVWPTGATNEPAAATASLLATYGLDPETSVGVRFKTTEGDRIRVSFGQGGEQKRTYALIEDGTAIVTIDDSLVAIARDRLAPFIDTRLIPAESAAIKTFSMTEGDVSCVLTCGESGLWRIDSPVSAPADQEVVAKVLSRIMTLTTADQAQEGLRISALTNMPPVIVPRARVLADIRLDDLRAKEILSVDPRLVRRIVSTVNAKQPVSTSVVYNRDRAAWNIETSAVEGRVSEGNLGRVLTALNPLRASRIVQLRVSAADLARYGLETPRLKLAIDLDQDNATRRNILIGTQTAGGSYATVGSSEAVFILPNKVIQDLTAPLVDAK